MSREGNTSSVKEASGPSHRNYIAELSSKGISRKYDDRKRREGYDKGTIQQQIRRNGAIWYGIIWFGNQLYPEQITPKVIVQDELEVLLNTNSWIVLDPEELRASSHVPENHLGVDQVDLQCFQWGFVERISASSAPRLISVKHILLYK